MTLSITLLNIFKKTFQLKRKLVRGFTLLEILLVLALIGIIFSISPPLYSKVIGHSAMDSNVSTLVSVLQKAETSSMSSLYDSVWGVKILNNQFVLFKGDSYDNRDTAFDDVYDTYGTFTTRGSDEIIFPKVNNTLMSTSTITITDEERSVDVSINELGLISYEKK